MRPLFYLHQSSMTGNGHPPCVPLMHPCSPPGPSAAHPPRPPAPLPELSNAETLPPAVWTKVLRGPAVEESPEVQEHPRLPASPPRPPVLPPALPRPHSIGPDHLVYPFTTPWLPCCPASPNTINAIFNPVGRSSRSSASSPSLDRPCSTRQPSSRHPSRASHLGSSPSTKRAPAQRPSTLCTTDRPAPSMLSRPKA